MAGRENLNNFLFTLFGFKKVKSRTHILFIILIHISGWCLLFFLPVLMYPVRMVNNNWFISGELADKAVLVAVFYLNYYLFIPRFFEKKRYLNYALMVMFAFCLYLFQHMMVRFNVVRRGGGPFHMVSLATESTRQGLQNDSAFFTRPNLPIEVSPTPYVFIDSLPSSGAARQAIPVTLSDSFNPPMTRPFPFRESLLFGIPKGILAMSLNNAISSFALLLLMGGFIRLAYSFIRNQNEKKVLENVNLNAEVNFLKSQINPHFLFNTLNSIYSQAHSRSEKTEFSILKLSELLRYVLYDSGEEKVELAKDISYINNYIDLQRLRLSNRVVLNYTISGNPDGKTIAPLLMISFIENAFKHGISYTTPSTIDIDIQIFEKTLTLTVSNPIVERDTFAPGGLGLKNVKRRLELLYPEHHQLNINRHQDLHIVYLKIDLCHA